MTFSDAEYAQDSPTIALKDATGRSLVCQIEQTFEIEGRQYALLLPLDTPVEIFAWEADDSSADATITDVDESQIEVLFPTAQAVLSERDLTLQHSAITLTVAGDIPEPEEDDCFSLDISDDDLPGETLNEDFQILATFFDQGIKYTVCTPIDPLLLFAHIAPSGEAEIVPPEEFERLRTEIESTLFDVLE